MTEQAPVLGLRVGVYHWRLRAAREQAGLTQADLALLTGYSLQIIGPLETLRRLPTVEQAQEIADALAVDVAWLWPEALAGLQTAHGALEIGLPADQVRALLASTRDGESEPRVGLPEAMASALSRLPPAERRVLLHRYGIGHSDKATLAAVGAALGISAERVGQLEAAGLRKLRKWPLRKLLEETDR